MIAGGGIAGSVNHALKNMARGFAVSPCERKRL
jgi:hypothetical protein